MIPKSKYDPSALRRWEDQQSRTPESQPTTSNTNPAGNDEPEMVDDPDLSQTDLAQPGPSTSKDVDFNRSREIEYTENPNCSFEELFLRSITTSTPVQKAKKNQNSPRG